MYSYCRVSDWVVFEPANKKLYVKDFPHFIRDREENTVFNEYIIFGDINNYSKTNVNYVHFKSTVNFF